MIDLLVAGGGPAGLATAIHAALAGLDVVVVEPRPAPIDKACGEGLMPGAVRALAALDVALTGHPIYGIRYLDDRYRAEGRFRHGAGMGVRRTVLHAALSRRAAELGVPTLQRKVTAVHQDGDSVTAAGLTARYLVAADGLHSPIRRQLGLERTDPRPPRHGLRRHFAVAPWTDCVEVHWSALGEAYVTPLGPDLIGVAILTGERMPFDALLPAFPALLHHLASQAASAVRGAGPMRRRVRARVAGRVLLVGDAAGYIDALTGEGISLSLTGAAHLVRCVRAGRPQEYEQAWRRATLNHHLLTGALVRIRASPLLAPRIVPLASRAPALFTALVNRLA
ncbi:NAD(P)/FAD-dependent oxidoreductase [Kitasatospora sp. NPDC048545]|uniref:NAD(P)/FAD-dependent oxidoreductase n=1 Tax=Kitasatospora sp. NPDC048545 TaxID=3157208 RepID=UPI0033DC9CEC